MLVGGVAPARGAEVTVLADGSGGFPTVQAALDAAPKGGHLPHVIRLGAGTFRGKIVAAPGKGPIHLVGAGPGVTVLAHDDFADEPTAPTGDSAPPRKLGTAASASVSLRSDDLVAEGITFRNDHGKGSQAVALEVAGQRLVFRRCEIVGWQDTLHVRRGSAMFKDCLVSGHCDFIFGGGAAWFEGCEIRSLEPGFITAPSTDAKELYGLVFSRCRFTPEAAPWKTFLGRPWQPHGSVVILNSSLPATIRPEGWDNWGNPANEKTARFAEGGNTGPGADRSQRVAWSRELGREEMRSLNPMLALGWDVENGLRPERLAALPEAERTAWVAYLDRSDRCHAAEVAALAAELKAAGRPEPLLPPAGGDFNAESLASPAQWNRPKVKALADAILSFQTPTGGWSKHVDFAKGPRQPGMHWSSQGTAATPWHYVGTFDNRSTTEQVRFLMDYWPVSKRDDVRQAFLRGLDYIVAAQFPTGGWPQVYPLEGGYHDNITYNDNATTLILRTLEAVGRLDPAAGLVDPARLEQARTSFRRGLDSVLRLQVRQRGTPTVWCAQYDPLSLAPAGARLKEPPSLSGEESVRLVEFLMQVQSPSTEVKAAIENALAWFERNAITGLRKTKRDGRTWYDPDPGATGRLWARFYDASTNRPLFPGSQDGFLYDSFNEMQARNTARYDFYTDNANELLGKRQARWRQMLAGGKKPGGRK